MSKILVLTTPEEFKAWRRAQSESVGFVPTMGALHLGHAELLKRSCNENKKTVLSIFVNPTQFNDPSDLKKYPKTWEADLTLAEKMGVDVIFYPEFSSMYPDQYRYKVTEQELSRKFCGAHRPGHFDGVLTVVMKLFNIVEPTRAYFGEKDYQQMLLIKDMAQSFFMNLEIIPVPTIREADGLAMSSRNINLTAKERELAPEFNKVLRTTKTADEAIDKLSQLGFKVDYVEDWQQRRFAAAFLGSVRLIDNVEK